MKMSLSTPEVGSTLFSASSAFNSPVFNNRYDRFCGECSGVLVDVALERIPNFTCGRCTSTFCENCGRNNQYYDPERPSRIEKSQMQRIKEKLRVQLRKEIRAEIEAEMLSQSCLKDGKFDDDGNPVDKDDGPRNEANERNDGSELEKKQVD